MRIHLVSHKLSIPMGTEILKMCVNVTKYPIQGIIIAVHLKKQPYHGNISYLDSRKQR